MNTNYVVSVRLMTYNHGKFIKEAMDGIMMQKTSFPVEIVVGDDFSTDDTLDIIKSYSDTENIHVRILDRPIDGAYFVDRQKKGRLYNFQNIIENCTGKYIALLDGDDYWTDPLKLQKQVDFLEGNINCSLVGTMNSILNEKSELEDAGFRSGVFNLSDLITKHRCHTSTFLFRRKKLIIPNWFVDTKAGDTSLIWLCALKGDIQVLPDVTSVYRVHNGGVISSKSEKETHAVILENLNFLKKYFPDNLDEIECKIKARKSYFLLWDYSFSALFKRNTPWKAWVFYYYNRLK